MFFLKAYVCEWHLHFIVNYLICKIRKCVRLCLKLYNVYMLIVFFITGIILPKDFILIKQHNFEMKYPRNTYMC